MGLGLGLGLAPHACLQLRRGTVEHELARDGGQVGLERLEPLVELVPLLLRLLARSPPATV